MRIDALMLLRYSLLSPVLCNAIPNSAGDLTAVEAPVPMPDVAADVPRQNRGIKAVQSRSNGLD